MRVPHLNDFLLRMIQKGNNLKQIEVVFPNRLYEMPSGPLKVKGDGRGTVQFTSRSGVKSHWGLDKDSGSVEIIRVVFLHGVSGSNVRVVLGRRCNGRGIVSG